MEEIKKKHTSLCVCGFDPYASSVTWVRLITHGLSSKVGVTFEDALFLIYSRVVYALDLFLFFFKIYFCIFISLCFIIE